jgi:tetratricopeptide (TPR) repeat protein/4-amino-4-deoxy-L-arabinose transferase-like glycosyltransferase
MARGGAVRNARAGNAPRAGVSRDFLYLLAPALLAVALRIAYCLQVRDAPLYLGLGLDAKFYHRWAERIAAGDWIGHHVFFMGPVYPYFLGVIYLFGGGPFAARIVQAFVGGVTALLTGYLGREVGGRWAGVLAGFMAAIYGPFILFDSEILFPVLQAPLVAGALLLLLRARRAPTPRRWLLSGVMLGVAAVGNGSVLPFAAVAAAWAWWQGRSRGKGPSGDRIRALRAPALLAAGVAIAVLPVTVRNAVVGHDLVLITSNAGLNFYIGNGSEASGSYIKPAGLDVERDPEGKSIAEAAEGRPLSPSQVSGWWMRRAWKDIGADPFRAARRWGRKLFFYWQDYEIPQIENFAFQRRDSVLLRSPFPTFGMLVALAVMGCALLPARRRDAWILALFPITHSLVIASFFVVGRYRASAVPPLMALAAGGVVFLAMSLRGGAYRRGGLALAGAVAVFALTLSNPFHVQRQSGFAQCHFRQGVQLQRAGRVNEAETEFRRSLELDPSYAPAELNLGSLLAAAGRPDKAVPHFRRATELDPTYARARYNLGSALEDLGDRDGAMAAYGRASRLDPGWPPPLEGMARLRYVAGDFGAAETLFRQLAQMPAHADADDPEEVAEWAAPRGRAMFYLDLMERRRQLGDLLGGTADKPEWGRLLAADAAWGRGDVAGAIAGYDSVAAASHDAPLAGEALYEAGVAAYSSGDLAAAEPRFEAAEERYPEQPLVHFALGNVALLRGDVERARDMFLAETRRDPKHADSWLNLGALYENALDDPAAALDAYRHYLDLGGAKAGEILPHVRALEASLGEGVR